MAQRTCDDEDLTMQDWARVVEIDLRGRPKIAVTRVIPQRMTLGMGQGMRLRLELRYILSKTKLKLQVGI